VVATSNKDINKIEIEILYEYFIEIYKYVLFLANQ
jgi:hypothetical protein